MDRRSKTGLFSAILSIDGIEMLLSVIANTFSIIEVQKVSKSVYVPQIYRRLNFVLPGVDVVKVRDMVWEIGDFSVI